MAQDNSARIRDESLRLTLSSHEKAVIDKGLSHSRRAIKILAGISAVCGTIFAVSILVNDHYLERYNDSNRYLLLASVVSSIIGFVALLKLALATVDFMKYRSYQKDHEKFLKHYRRGI